MKVEQDLDGFWTVYSSMFDYMAYGKTQEEALELFEKGLHATIIEREKVGLYPISDMEKYL